MLFLVWIPRQSGPNENFRPTQYLFTGVGQEKVPAIELPLRLRAVDLVFLSDLLLPFGCLSVPVMKAPRLSIFDLFLINRASTLIINSSTYIWPQQQVRILQILYFYLNTGIPLYWGGLIRGRSSLRGSCGWNASWFGWARLGPSSAQWAAG